MNTTLDNNGQPLIDFNREKNLQRDKAYLKGLLLGAIADGEVVEEERRFLLAHLQENDNLVDILGGDYEDLLDVINSIDSGEYDDEDALELFEDMLSYNEALRFNDDEKAAVNKVLGTCAMMLSDNLLQDEEVYELEKLLANLDGKLNEMLVQLKNEVASVLEDSVVTENERIRLQKSINNLTNCSFFETGDVSPSTILFNESDYYSVLNASEMSGFFCLTGRGVNKDERLLVRNKLVGLGLVEKKRVTANCDYLIAFEESSRDWRYKNFGTKITTYYRMKSNPKFNCKLVKGSKLSQLLIDI